MTLNTKSTNSANRINKKDLVKQIKTIMQKKHNEHEISMVSISNVIDSLVEGMMHYIKQNKEVFWSGFGTLEIQKRKQTMRRNPQNGQEIKIPAKEVVKMKLFKSFADKCMKKTGKKK